MMKSEEGINKFFAIARERYQILLNRRAGMPKPWSQDPIFQREYFCNVFREDDRTTEWFRNNIRDEVQNISRTVLIAIAAFRWFNKIETGEKIKDILISGKWDSTKVFNRLATQKPVVTGAYIIKTPDGMQKLRGVIWCIDKFIENLTSNKFDDALEGKNCTLEKACQLLKQSPYLGNFMSWQICSDARQTCLLDEASDRDTWAQPGPGSARGLGRVYYGDVDHFSYGSKKDENEMLALMNDLRIRAANEKYWPSEWPKLAVIDVSHTLCEVDKYMRCEEGGRMKRKYRAS